MSIVAFLLTKGTPRRPLKAGAGWRGEQSFQEKPRTGAVCLVCTVFVCLFFFLKYYVSRHHLPIINFNTNSQIPSFS